MMLLQVNVSIWKNIVKSILHLFSGSMVTIQQAWILNRSAEWKDSVTNYVELTYVL